MDAGGELDDFPIPLAPGAQVLFSQETDGIRTALYTVTEDERDATVAFYDDWTSAQSDEFTRTEAEAGGVGWINAQFQILVSAALDGEVQVQLLAQP